MDAFTVYAFYKFVSLEDYESLRKPLSEKCLNAGIVGTILLASEGINGTIAGSAEGIEAVLAYLREDPRLEDLSGKVSYTEDCPFNRMKVHLKKEIVTLGVPWVKPTERVGEYVKPKDWNALIADPDVVLIDTRNDYEVKLGTFKGAINPKTQSFRELPDYVEKHLDPVRHKKVAMCCTGGIRCEKSTSYLLEMGFENVYHLEGGILKYLEDVPEEESTWEGECFVFDKRVSVDHALQKGKHAMCFACQHPLDPSDLASPKYEEGVACPYCQDTIEPERRARFAERQKQIVLQRERFAHARP